MKRFALLSAAVIVVVLGWSIAWIYFAGQIRTAISAGANMRPRAMCAQLDIGGYPFRFDVTCTDFQLTDNDLTIDLPQLQLVALVYQPTHVIAFAKSPATLTDAFSGSMRQLAWSNLEASVRFNGWRPERLSLVGDDLSWSDVLLGDEQLAATKHLEFHLIDDGDAKPQNGAKNLMNLAVYSALGGADFPSAALEKADARLDADITDLPADIRAWAQPGLLPAWQAAGGAIDLTGFSLTAPKLDAKLAGKLDLDAAHRVHGSLVLTSKGLAARLTPLIQPAFVNLTVGQQQADGSYRQTFSFMDGFAKAGQSPLMQLDPLF